MEKSGNGRLANQKMDWFLWLSLRCAISKSELLVLDQQQNRSAKDMSQESEFPFEKARRVTAAESAEFRTAIADQFGMELRKRGRPTKEEEEKYEPISIRLHPKVLAWAKAEAEQRGIGYQTVINEVLLAQIN
jgi:uncharacterized protein (DUF4415 family)